MSYISRVVYISVILICSKTPTYCPARIIVINSFNFYYKWRAVKPKKHRATGIFSGYKRPKWKLGSRREKYFVQTIFSSTLRLCFFSCYCLESTLVQITPTKSRFTKKTCTSVGSTDFSSIREFPLLWKSCVAKGYKLWEKMLVPIERGFKRKTPN